MIIVNFDSEKDTYKTAAGLWQWDYGQVLQLVGLSLPAAVEIHFSLQQSGGDAITRIGVTEDGITTVDIPDEMLENGGKTVDYYIYAFVYVSDETSGKTTYRISMSVKSRPRPKRVSETTMEALMAAINQIAAGKADSLEYKDGILKLMSGDQELDQVEIAGESSGTISDAQIQVAVENYLDANPVQAGATTEQAEQIRKNTQEISKLSEDLNDLKGQIGQGGSGTGIKGLADLCLALKGAKYETLEASQSAQRFVEANEGIGSDEPTTPTLTSITVTWSADSADAGTDPKTLITSVKANYSDGTSQTVTGYTVTPTSLVEGNNTVTVTYNGKSATKSITGVAEQTGGAEVVMLAPVQKTGSTVTDYSDGGQTAFVGLTTNNTNRWMVRSEKVFDKDTVLHVQMSKNSQTYNAVDLFSCDTEVWDGVSAVKENGYGFYGVKTVDSAEWKNPFSLDTEYTVKAGYAFMYCTYSATDANTLNVTITEVA